MRLIVNLLSILSVLYTSIYFKNISIDRHSTNHSYAKVISSLVTDYRIFTSSADVEVLTVFSNLFYFDNSDKIFTRYISKFLFNILDTSVNSKLKNFYVYIFSGVSPPLV